MGQWLPHQSGHKTNRGNQIVQGSGKEAETPVYLDERYPWMYGELPQHVTATRDGAARALAKASEGARD